jgi:hypothetical protein
MGWTYRLKRCCAVVAILALARGAWLASGGNVWVVRLLAVGHDGQSNELVV